MSGCESWTIKKAEHRRTDVFELWYWRKLWRVTWTARRSNQSILKEISPEYSLEGLILKLKLQYFGHLSHLRRPWCWERLKAGGEGDDRGWDGWMASPTCYNHLVIPKFYWSKIYSFRKSILNILYFFHWFSPNNGRMLFDALNSGTGLAIPELYWYIQYRPPRDSPALTCEVGPVQNVEQTIVLIIKN